MSVDVINVSTKGQVVLPVAMRRALEIEPGDRLAVYATDDVIVLRKLDLPTDVEYDEWLGEARKHMLDA